MVQPVGSEADQIRVDLVVLAKANLEAVRAVEERLGALSIQARNTQGHFEQFSKIQEGFRVQSKKTVDALKASAAGFGNLFPSGIITSAGQVNQAFVSLGKNLENYATEAINTEMIGAKLGGSFLATAQYMQILGNASAVTSGRIQGIIADLQQLASTAGAAGTAVINQLVNALEQLALKQELVTIAAQQRVSPALTQMQKAGQGLLLSFSLVQGMSGNLSSALFGLGFAVIFTGMKFLNLTTAIVAVSAALGSVAIEKLTKKQSEGAEITARVTKETQKLRDTWIELQGETKLTQKAYADLAEEGVNLIAVFAEQRRLVEEGGGKPSFLESLGETAETAGRGLLFFATGAGTAQVAWENYTRSVEEGEGPLAGLRAEKKGIEALKLAQDLEEIDQENTAAFRALANSTRNELMKVYQEFKAEEVSIRIETKFTEGIEADREKVSNHYDLLRSNIEKHYDNLNETIKEGQASATDSRQRALQNETDAINEALKNQTKIIRKGLKDQLEIYSEALEVETDNLKTIYQEQVEVVNDARDAQIEVISDGLKDELEVIQDGLNAKTDAIREALDDEIDTIRDALNDRLEVIRDAAQDEIDAEREKIDAIKKQERELESALSALQQRRAAIRNEILGAEAQLAALEREATLTGVGATEEQAIVKARIAGLKAEDVATQNTIKQREAARDTLLGQVDTIEAIIEAIEEARDDEIEAARDTAEETIEAAQKAADERIDIEKDAADDLKETAQDVADNKKKLEQEAAETAITEINKTRDTAIQAAQTRSEAEQERAREAADVAIEEANRASTNAQRAAQDRADADIRGYERAAAKAIELNDSVEAKRTETMNLLEQTQQRIIDGVVEEHEKRKRLHEWQQNIGLPLVKKFFQYQIAFGAIQGIGQEGIDPVLRAGARKAQYKAFLESLFPGMDITEFLEGYQLGTRRVPGAMGQPQLAVVHGGEAITPPGLLPPASAGFRDFNLSLYLNNEADFRRLEKTLEGVFGKSVSIAIRSGLGNRKGLR